MLSNRRAALSIFACALVAVPAAALAAGQHCRREQRSKLLLSETLQAQTDPLGVENNLSLSFCTPLIEKPGLLFDLTNITVGVVIRNPFE